MSEKVSFEVEARTDGVTRPLQKAGEAVRDLKKAALEVDRIDIGAAMAENFKRSGVEIGKATQQMKRLAREEAAAAKKSQQGGWLGGLGVSLAGKLGPLAVAGLATAAASKAGGAALAREEGVATLAAAQPEGAEALVQKNEALGVRFGVSANELHRQAARLSQAGFSTEQVARAIEANVVAAGGDEARLEGLMDELVEAGTRGYLEESLLGKFDEVGVGLRTELMKRLDMGKEQLESALSAGKVGVEQFFEVIGRVTGEGSKAMAVAEARAKTTAGAWRRLVETSEQGLAALGEQLTGVVEGPLTAAAEKLQGLLKFIKAPAAEYLTYEKGPEERESDRRAAMQAEAGERLRQQREALEGVLSENAKAYRELAAAAEEARRAEARANETLAERRARVMAAVGLSTDATTAEVDAALKSDSGFAAAREAAGTLARRERAERLVAQAAQWGLTEKATRGDVDRAHMAHGGEMDAWRAEYSNLALQLGTGGGTLGETLKVARAGVREAAPGDLARAEALLAARKELAEIEKAEKAVAAATAKETARREEALDALRAQREMMAAKLSKNDARVMELEAQGAAVKRQREYEAAGISQDEAAQAAARDVRDEFMLRAREKDAAAEAAAGMTMPQSTGWLRTGLQEVGGAGGANARLYDSPAVTAAKDTAANTAAAAKATENLLKFLQAHAMPAVLD